MGASKFQVDGKSVIVAGGSKGLGRELSLELVRWGAHVTILARDIQALEETRQVMQRNKLRMDQNIGAESLDLVDSRKVEEYVNSLDKAPWAVFCVAGGTSEEIGFFADVSSHSIRACMEKNYFSSAFIANAMMKRWIADSSCQADTLYPHHHLIFTTSTAALVAVPGYAAYAPAKAGIRALADILRMEALMYKSTVEINVHCSFPGTIYTESFFEEQMKKPELCKQIEGTEKNLGGQSAEQIARKILSGLNNQEYFITTDLLTRCLLTNMRGSSPPDTLFVDSILGFGWRLIWPFVRRHMDKATAKFGKKEKAK